MAAFFADELFFSFCQHISAHSCRSDLHQLEQNTQYKVIMKKIVLLLLQVTLFQKFSLDLLNIMKNLLKKKF